MLPTVRQEIYTEDRLHPRHAAEQFRNVPSEDASNGDFRPAHPAGSVHSGGGDNPEEPDPEEEARRKAMKEVVQSWMDRLQLISLITTFFASVEAGMLQITTPNDPDDLSPIEEATNATLLGALVVHVNAAVISFMAAFFLISYKVKAAKHDELKVEGVSTIDMEEHPHASSSSLSIAEATRKIAEKLDPSQRNEKGKEKAKRKPRAPEPYVWSANPNLVQVGPFQGQQPPIRLLSRCHALCILLSVVGFVLALAGIVCFAWARQSRSVGIFTSACMGVVLLCGATLLKPSDRDDSLMYTS